MAHIEGPVDPDSAVSVIPSLKREANHSQVRMATAEVCQVIPEAVRAFGIGDHDLDRSWRHLLPRQTFEAEPESFQVPEAGDQDRDLRSGLLASPHCFARPD